DSLYRVLDRWRADSSTIAVAIEMETELRSATSAERDEVIERVLLHVKPDVLIPGWRSPLPTLLEAREPSLQWWQTMLTRAGHVVNRVRPRTALGWAAARVDPRDSAVYAWASSEDSPVRVLGVVSFPSFAGLPAVDARLRAFDRWHALANTNSNALREYWLMEVGGLPRAHGDVAQTAAMMRALAWATRRPWISTAILGDAGDYDGAIGLRAANGRLRSAVGVLSRASRGMNEAVTNRPAVGGAGGSL
ncbi:MAG: hypothetical protein ABJC26_05545, partial [Gemmatimonadaceae bacterium]